MFNIVFISYQEPNADNNWDNLKSRFPSALRVHGVNGIHTAHKTSAQNVLSLQTYIQSMITENNKLFDTRSYTHFWVVDGDSIVAEDFNFEPSQDLWDDAVYVYRAQNPVNGLSYGYGGIKLLPVKETANMLINGVDMTTSISKNFFVVDQIASVTNFNTDPFNTWKSAFRECSKLSSAVIDRQQQQETDARLDAWCTLNDAVPYGFYSYAGALAGRQYGTDNKNNPEALKKINDFSWLEKQFSS